MDADSDHVSLKVNRLCLRRNERTETLIDRIKSSRRALLNQRRAHDDNSTNNENDDSYNKICDANDFEEAMRINDEEELIDLLGIDDFQEVMLRIEADITAELNGGGDYLEDSDTAALIKEFDDGIDFFNDKILCPGCGLCFLRSVTTGGMVECVDCGWEIMPLSAKTGAQLSDDGLRLILGSLFERHMAACSYKCDNLAPPSASSSSIVGDKGDRCVPTGISGRCSLVYTCPGRMEGGIVHAEATLCSFSDFITW